uniref:AAA+ ATPase domain-containing protein n=1 Tax=Hildenbrandia rubra TaxID=31481 RepID=A0A1C9CFU5_9FLOR|nr:hypothetical protein Hrub_009 [Hildenbrandia rubra]AOM67253.1 hypothetical protein Hrub_009 [Hildenbrandia rubra]|eukprot:Plantae.Rhodophyta-Hildenbrandia_rubra.ctg1921.p1 GENE.Plantae.Rhodophyta-Hildenbrandia_rubra.ctg1921~~Plantae.Rhodophyta-Hildenbrandia_rubra.ctg1921.p1  ORF type:complete len:558 (-),score=24.74 Plantae.Rhodophyta-Hildenbrandia_rubra.ctg1921:391-2064(-)
MLIADDLDKLLEILPDPIKNTLKKHSNNRLLEIILDLGRRPEARFLDKPQYLSRKIVSWQDLDHCIKRIGHFSGDNRSGIEKTLHRISSIRNRKGNIIGLTCRVGRALFGTINIVRDLLEKQQSILILGKPGIGKTTAIREIARILADEMQKRVIVIDTSNEIAGDGDIPHPAIGRARRMQVALPELQHQVMIEAVENHMPEVIIIDEISTELEVLAARTIAERGVQLVGTVHGNFLDNLIKNPTLCDLIGGIQYVTLGDDEAKRRGTQKSILERKATPAFQIAIEIHERQSWIIHEKLDATIDQILQGYYAPVQCRNVLPNGKLIIYSNKFFTDNSPHYLNKPDQKLKQPNSKYIPSKNNNPVKSLLAEKSYLVNSKLYTSRFSDIINNNQEGYINIYIYLISYSEVNKIIETFNMPLVICKDIDKADVVLALRFHVRQNIQLRQIAKSRQIMIYTIHSSTSPQITRALKRIVSYKIRNLINWQKVFYNKTEIEVEALEETRAAIENIILTRKQPVQLLPRPVSIRNIQQKLVNIYNFKVRVFGEYSERCLRIYLI